MMTSLLGISGSLRGQSTNTRLVRAAARRWDGLFTLADIRFPLYDNDDETTSGIPEAVSRLAAQIGDADAILISTPEYNQSLSGVLKNALDWASRVKPQPWTGKPVAIMSAAAGRSGGARGNYALRLAMTPFRPRLLTREVLLADARNQFDDGGELLSERYRDQVETLMGELSAEARRGG